MERERGGHGPARLLRGEGGEEGVDKKRAVCCVCVGGCVCVGVRGSEKGFREGRRGVQKGGFSVPV